MPITPRLITSREGKIGQAGTPPTLWRAGGKLFGRRAWWFNTDSETAAWDGMAGVADQGTPWDAAHPFLLVVSQGPTEYVGGTSDALGIGGVTVVPVEYATPGGGGSNVPPPVAGSAYTEFVQGIENETAYYRIYPPDFVGPPDPDPVGNGQGMPVEVTTLVLRVHRFIGRAEAIGLSTWISLSGRTNSNVVTLPALYTTNEQHTFQPGQLRYRTCTPQANGEAIELVHEMVANLDHHFRWREQDERGRGTGALLFAERYPPRPFPLF